MKLIRRRAGSGRRTLGAVLAAAWLASAGCGADSEYANELRPPAPINVTAAVSGERLQISPRSFGAGPIVLIIANRSVRSHQFTLETESGPGGSPGIRQTTSAVNPRGTAELKVDVAPGTYRLSVRSGTVRPAAIRVGKARPSAQGELLQP